MEKVSTIVTNFIDSMEARMEVDTDISESEKKSIRQEFSNFYERCPHQIQESVKVTDEMEDWVRESDNYIEHRDSFYQTGTTAEPWVKAQLRKLEALI